MAKSMWRMASIVPEFDRVLNPLTSVANRQHVAVERRIHRAGAQFSRESAGFLRHARLPTGDAVMFSCLCNSGAIEPASQAGHD